MTFDLAFYWRLLLRRLPVMLALLLVCAGFGAAFALRLPTVYTASSLLVVESPQIPEQLAASTVQTAAAEQLQVIEQRLTTRSNLIDMANRFDIFENRAEMTADGVVEAMRDATGIRWTAGRGDTAILLTVTFETRSAGTAATVVNEFVTQILSQNADFRMSRVEGTLEFFEQEVARLGTELDRQSARIAEFNAANADALPAEQSFRLNRQTLLQERQARLEREIAGLDSQRDRIMTIFDTTGQVTPAQITGPVAPPLSPDEQRLLTLQNELATAREIFSDDNPRVRALLTRIAQVETRVAAAKSEEEESSNVDAEADPAEDTATPTDPNQMLLEVTLAELETRQSEMRTELETTIEELAALDIAIRSSAVNALELAALERDFETIRLQHDRAVQNLNTARLGERIEVGAQGQRISVIEAATPPTTPSGPKRLQVAALGVATGMGLAGGYFFLLEVLNRAIRRPAELTARFGITPLATIPYMESRGRRWLRRGVLLTGIAVVLAGVPAALWWIDTNYMPLQVLFARGLDKLGLG